MATQIQGGAGDMDSSEITPLEFEEDLAMANSSLPDSKFDLTVGHIEDIIMEGDFHELQHNFLQKYYHEFDDSEENKFVYTDIHKQYVELIERYLQHQLADRMTDFSMAEFQKQLIERKEELEGEVFEMLLTFSDFLSFKEMVLDFKNEKEGNTVDLSGGLCVRSLSHDPSHAGVPGGIPVDTNSSGNVHNLDIGGGLMISGGGATTTTDLFGSGSNQISLQSQQFTPDVRNNTTTANGATSQHIVLPNNGSQQQPQSTEETEDMNISPRPQQMDL